MLVLNLLHSSLLMVVPGKIKTLMFTGWNHITWALLGHVVTFMIFSVGINGPLVHLREMPPGRWWKEKAHFSWFLFHSFVVLILPT